jgi:acyl-CoA synthetase (AMP-forming)/AMP-acid ligase II
MIHHSPLPDVEIPDLALTDLVLRRADERAAEVAFVDGADDTTMTYGQLRDDIAALAGGLVAGGFAKGDVVALVAPNCPDYAVVFHAVARAGGIVTTINPAYSAREINHQLHDSGARLLVAAEACLATVQEAAAGTRVEAVHLIGPGSGAPSVRDLAGAPLHQQVPVEPDDVVAMPYSSGTTGLSKGVMLTHRNLVANAMQTIGPAELGPDDVTIAALPFFHIYGMQVLMNCALCVGAKVVTMARFDLEGFLRLHERQRVTRCFAAPPIVLALAKSPLVEQFDLSSVRQVFSGAAPLSAELALEAAARLGCEVVQGYGMTELSPVSHITAMGQGKPGSAGVTAPNTELMVVDVASGSPLGPGVDGELWVRGPQVMKGYLGNEAATAATIDAEGWLHTGDIGHVDGDGHLFVVDRLKELIKVKGFQVPPAELEALLLTHPAVADAAVIGIPDDEAGEVPVAYVVRRPTADPTAPGLTDDELGAFVAGQVAHYKRLRRVTFVDSIPKSPSGKILRRVLRDEVAGR